MEGPPNKTRCGDWSKTNLTWGGIRDGNVTVWACARRTSTGKWRFYEKKINALLLQPLSDGDCSLLHYQWRKVIKVSQDRFGDIHNLIVGCYWI